MNAQIVPGSISAMAQLNGKSIAETFMNADVVILVDTSGSMSSKDSRGGRSRYDVATDELKQLQASLPGKIAVVSFSDAVQFCPSGITQYLGGGTDLAAGLKFIKVADGIPGMKFIVISDGQPNDEVEALKAAKTFKNKIDVIYVGPEERPAGRDFLQQLAAATGGQSITVDRAKELGTGVRTLLGAGTK